MLRRASRPRCARERAPSVPVADRGFCRAVGQTLMADRPAAAGPSTTGRSVGLPAFVSGVGSSVRGMETAFGVLILFGIVAWICVRALASSEQSATKPETGAAVRSQGGAELSTPRSPSGIDHDDQAFVDGYIWGRLQERHDEHQQHGGVGSHDDAMLDSDDCSDGDG